MKKSYFCTMRIRKKFLQLTKFTYPHGTEDFLTSYLPKGYQIDEHGNYFYTIGDDYSTMFTCHLDTACSYFKKINHKFEDDGNIVKTDGKTILGADDKAGMIVLLYMIKHKIPGIYYFFIGEEVGCIGSSALADNFDIPNIDKIVSFDRRGTDSVITDQMFGRCCSDKFALELSNRLNETDSYLNFSPDSTGVMTDSAQFTELVPECTNISVGYYDEHTKYERQDIDHLRRLCKACVKINWETLPVERDPSVIDDFYSRYEGMVSPYESANVNVTNELRNLDLICGYTNKEFNEYNYTYIIDADDNNQVKKMYISDEWIELETKELDYFLISQGYKPLNIIWNGRECWCDEGNGHRYIGSREDISHLMDDLMYIPNKHLKVELHSILPLKNAEGTSIAAI